MTAVLTVSVISAYLILVVTYAYFAPIAKAKAKAKVQSAKTGILGELFINPFRAVEIRTAVVSQEIVPGKPKDVTRTTVRTDGRPNLIETSKEATEQVKVHTDILVIRETPFLALCMAQVCVGLKVKPPARRIIVLVMNQVVVVNGEVVLVTDGVKSETLAS